MSRTAHAKLAKRLADAIAARAPLAALTVELSLDEAKRVRRQITTIRADGQVGGINAGGASRAAQSCFELDHPLIARLCRGGRRDAGCAPPFFAGRAITCELAIFDLLP